MSGGRRRKGGHGAEFHLDERWMTSYADMITVLMCLFIVLYAMSTVNSHKFDILKNSLASGFGVTNSKKLDLTKGVPVPKKYVTKNGIGFTVSQQAGQLKLTKELGARIEQALQKAGVSSKAAEVTVHDDAVTVGLVGSATYFGGNDASLTPAGYRVLNAIGPTFKTTDRVVTVEGHADPHGSAGPYQNDWALAAARATTVLTYLVDRSDVPGARISAISYGSARPVTTATGDEERNRRVDIVVHTPTAPATTGSTTATTASDASDTKDDAASK